MAEHNDLGKWGEDEAALYLEDEGYTIIDRDWRLGRSGGMDRKAGKQYAHQL